MPRGVKKNTNLDVDAVIDQFAEKLKQDLHQLHMAGFHKGAETERKRIAEVFQGGAVSKAQVSPKSNPENKTVSESKPKKTRKNPWAAYTPEQREARLKILADARAKGRAGKIARAVDAGNAEYTASGDPQAAEDAEQEVLAQPE